MENPQQLTSLTPFETSDVPPPSPDVVPQDPPDVIQLKLDIINVEEGRVSIDSFSPAYQKKIRNYYRFYGQRSTPKEPFYPKLIRSTLDAV